MAINKLVGKTIGIVTVAWLVHMAINKLVRNLVKVDPKSITKDDPPSVTLSSDESPPPRAEKDDLASLPSSSAESPPRAQKHDVFMNFRDVDTGSVITNGLCSTSSASLASAHRWNHDAFLSFRGVDTREGITSTIYDRLQNMRGIKTFMDGYMIQVGDDISPTLLTAIKESRFAVVVLSQHFADSTWCLEELTIIFQCMKDKNRILPLFYHVDPSDVRHQRGSFKDAFTKHESRHDIGKVKLWKEALRNVANLSGWDSNNYQSDEELVEDIVKLVYSKVLQVRIETSGDFEAFESTKIALDKVMEGLQNNVVTIIGLYGIGGVGKTSLAKHVGAQARENGIFNTVIMARVSQNLELKEIQDQLADMLALNLGEHNEEGRAVVLKNAILGGKKLLIILDDMWKKIPLSSIGIPNNEELQKCNSKVLFTTETHKVCQEMHSDAMINLQKLSEEDSVKLYLKRTRRAFCDTTLMYNVARELTRNCAGVPVALIEASGTLPDEDLDELKEATEQLHESQPVVFEDVLNYVKSCYDDDLSTDAKSCLLLCCLFPKDYDIPIEDLFMYGIGRGLFQESNTLQEARTTIDLLLESLKASRMLLESEKKGCVRMNVIRDVVMSISSREDGEYIFVKSGQDQSEWPRIETNINYTAISLMHTKIQELPKELVCSKLSQILSLNKSQIRKIPGTFFQSQNVLRVLDLRETVFWKLPSTLSLLTNLRVLLIPQCAQWNLNVLGKFGKLEVLSLRFYFMDFPTELGQLSKLRMLDISNPCRDWFPPQVISRLINLEELYMKGNCIWGNKYNLCCEEFIRLPNLNILEVQIHDVGCLPEVVEFNPHWLKFDITFNASKYVDYLEKLPLHESQKSLCLNTSILNLQNWFHKVVTERAEKLVYYWFQDMKNILREYSTGRLNGVKYLAIIRYSDGFEWRALINTVTWEVLDKPLFENLEELHVEEVPCAELCVGELPLGSFSNLKKFKVLDCWNLKNALLSSNLLRRLQNLEELVCAQLSGLEYVFGTTGMEPEHIIFTKLRKIHLNYLPKLIDICNGPVLPHAIFQNLKSLAVGQCPALRCLFPSRTIVECLVQLEELYVYDCPIIEAVIGVSGETDKVDMIKFPVLKILYLVNLYQLTRFYGTTGSHRPIINCPKLEQRCLHGSGGFDNDLNLSTFQSNKQVPVCDLIEYRSTRWRLHKESKGRCSMEWWDQIESMKMVA